MASKPRYRGNRKGQRVGFWLWNGYAWEDTRVTSAGNGSASAGLPFTGNLPKIDFGGLDFSGLSTSLSGLNFGNTSGGNFGFNSNLNLGNSNFNLDNFQAPEPPPTPSYPARGTEKARICRGNLTVIVRHNGTGGTYEDPGQLINGSCGYTPPPPPPVRGTSAGTECQGTTRVRKLHNGSGGYYYETIERNSRTCGYAPPPPPTPPVLMVEEDDTADSGLVLQDDGFDNTPPLFDFGNNDANGTVGSSVITPDNDSFGGSGIRGGGNSVVSGPSSFPIVTLYGPYSDECAAYAGKKSKGRIRAYAQDDFGDSFEVPKFWGNAQLRNEFNGGNAWYYDVNGFAIQISSSGLRTAFKTESELDEGCKPPCR